MYYMNFYLFTVSEPIYCLHSKWTKRGLTTWSYVFRYRYIFYRLFGIWQLNFTRERGRENLLHKQLDLDQMALLYRGVSSSSRSRVYSHQRNYARIQNQPRIKQKYSSSGRRNFCSQQNSKSTFLFVINCGGVNIVIAVNFNDTKAAFQAKSTPELLRAWFVFKVSAHLPAHLYPANEL